MKLKPLTCTNCAGTINRATMTCEYCGTKFESLYRDHELFMVVEHQSSPVRILKAQASIPDELLRDNCMDVTNYAMSNIREQLAKALEDCMEITMEYNPYEMRQVITARVRVLEPKYRF